MSLRAKLVAVHRPADPTGIVLVVHGGGSRVNRPTVRSYQPAVLIVHGDRDRVADPAKSLAVAEGLRRTGTVIYRPVAGGTHSMLWHRGQFDGVAGDFMATTLLGQEPTNRLRGESACGSA